MALRKMRWLAAGVLAAVAVLAAPARSAAATTIQIDEFATGSSTPLFTSSFTLATLPGGANPVYFPSGSQFNITSVGVGSTSGTASAQNSLSTTVTLKPGDAYDGTHTLKITVTDTDFINSLTGGPATLTNNPSLTTGLFNATNQSTGNTVLTSGSLNVQTGEITKMQNGPDALNTANISSLPHTFSITQVLSIQALPTGGGDVTGTFTGSLSSRVESSNPVPAPAGLVLALTAIPVLGLRRVFRRKASA